VRDHEITFGVEVQVLDSSYERGIDLISRAVECLRGGQPEHSPACEPCQFSQKRVEAALACIAK
jgi:hypothetical protein